MTRPTIEIDGAAVHGIPSLYAVLDRAFMPDEEWTLGESLDALDDLLYGGFGVLHGADGALVVWHDAELSRAALGVETTRAYYRAKLDRPDVYAAAPARRALEALDRGEGETYFDLVLRVFRGHTEVELVLD